MTHLNSDIASSMPVMLLMTESSSSSGIGESEMPAKVNLLGMDFDNFSKQELLFKLRKGVVFTPNSRSSYEAASRP